MIMYLSYKIVNVSQLNSTVCLRFQNQSNDFPHGQHDIWEAHTDPYINLHSGLLPRKMRGQLYFSMNLYSVISDG